MPSRLFWGAATLTPGDQNRWSDVMVGNQDFYTALFEQELEQPWLSSLRKTPEMLPRANAEKR